MQASFLQRLVDWMPAQGRTGVLRKMYEYSLCAGLGLMLRLRLLPVVYRPVAGRIVDWLKSGDLQQTPHELRRGMTLETVSICNAKCSFCSYPILEFPKQAMSPADFEKAMVLAESMQIKELDFTPYLGEAFVDPKFLDRVTAARQRLPDTRMTLTTNGTFLTRVDLPRLLGCGLDRINVSFGAWGRSDYQKLYNIDAWDRVHEGVGQLLDEKKRSGSPTKISLWFRVLDKKSLLANTEYLAFLERHKEVIDTHIIADVYHDIQAISGQQSKEIKLERHFDGTNLKTRPCANLGNVGISSSGNTFACYCVATDAYKQEASAFYLGKLSGSGKEEVRTGVQKMLLEWREKGPPQFCRTCPVYTPASDVSSKHPPVEENPTTPTPATF